MANSNDEPSFLSFLDKLIEKAKSSRLSITTDAEGMIIIKGINFMKLRSRMKEVYNDKRPFKMFIPVYNHKDMTRFENKQIARGQMRIEQIKIHPFYALEASIIFEDLFVIYRFSFYAKIVDYLKKNTWLADSIDNKKYTIDQFGHHVE